MLESPPVRDLPHSSAGLLIQFLTWIAARPRTYGEAMDAWRTSCPRLSVWEDALAEGLVEIRPDAATQAEAAVTLAPAGTARLAAHPPAHP